MDGSLRIWGLFEHGYAWAQYSTGDPPDAPVGEADLPPDCLTITIDEPGALTVSQDGGVMAFRSVEGGLLLWDGILD